MNSKNKRTKPDFKSLLFYDLIIKGLMNEKCKEKDHNVIEKFLWMISFTFLRVY